MNVFDMPFSKVYSCLMQKAERKGRNREEDQRERCEQDPLSHNRSSNSFRNRAHFASDGIRQSPRGDKETEPTFGPSGRQERLNCWPMKRLKKV